MSGEHGLNLHFRLYTDSPYLEYCLPELQIEFLAIGASRRFFSW